MGIRAPKRYYRTYSQKKIDDLRKAFDTCNLTLRDVYEGFIKGYGYTLDGMHTLFHLKDGKATMPYYIYNALECAATGLLATHKEEKVSVPKQTKAKVEEQQLDLSAPSQPAPKENPADGYFYLLGEHDVILLGQFETGNVKYELENFANLSNTIWRMHERVKGTEKSVSLNLPADEGQSEFLIMADNIYMNGKKIAWEKWCQCTWKVKQIIETAKTMIAANAA